VSFDAAKAHLRVYGTDEDDLIQTYLENAQHVVMDRLERSTTDSLVLAMFAEWDEDTTPGAIKAAVLTQMTEFYRFRGDEERLPAADNGRLSNQVERFLGSWLERPIA
jgi:hypothetical protein